MSCCVVVVVVVVVFYDIVYFCIHDFGQYIVDFYIVVIVAQDMFGNNLIEGQH